MEEVIVAAGSNLGNRQENLQNAGVYLGQLSEEPILKSSVWQSEPVGGAKFTFYNSAAKIKTSLQPDELLKRLKLFEQQCGREKNPERWGPRILDLDIISYGNLVIDNESLIIPHPEYHRRLFVLYPMSEIAPDWIDPKSTITVKQMIDAAPQIEINRTKITW